MKIGIITDSIREKSTGIGYYSKNLIINLLKTDKENKYFFIDYIKNDFNRKSLILIKNPFQNFFKTYTWHNTLPFQLRKLDVEFIFNLSGVPHLLNFRQREIFVIYDLSATLFPQFHTWWRVLLNKLLLKRNLKNAYKIVAISENTQRDIVKYFKIPEDKILTIYPSLPPQAKIEIKPKIPLKTPCILYIGTLEPRKNINLIIEAFHQLKIKNNFHHQLILGGKKGWGYSDIFTLVEKLKLEKDVIFTGYVTEEEKKYLYKHTDLFVYPSFYEGFGLPPLEAMSYGCPVITSNTSSLPEVVGNAAIQINPNNVTELYGAIKEVIENDKLRKKMITEGYKQAKKFSQVESLKELEKSLFKIISN